MGLLGLSGTLPLLLPGVMGVEGDIFETVESPPDLPLNLPVCGVLGPVIVLGEVFPCVRLALKEGALPNSINIQYLLD